MSTTLGDAWFLELTQVLDEIRGTAATSTKVARLAGYLATLSDGDLRRACTFLAGRPFPPGDGRRLGAGWAAIAQVLRDLTRAPEAEMRAAYRAHGDLGDAAATLLARYPPAAGLFVHRLTLAAVERDFAAIASAQGQASRRAKSAALAELLGNASPREAAYLIKIMTSDMRIGLREGLLLPAIAAAFGRDAGAVRQAALLIAEPGEVAVRARAGTLDHVTLVPGRPFRFMLASPLESPEEAFDEPARALWVEDKYDGVRVQVHRTAAGVVILSRTLDNVTRAFPELPPAIASRGGTYILDGEIVAWRGARALAFGRLQQRLQRRNPGALLHEIPVALVAFDLVHLDGRDLLRAPLTERRAALEALRLPPPVRLSTGGEAATPGDLAKRFAEARAAGNEGIVMKRPDAPYQPGRRGRLWTKWKPGVGTLDVVVVAAEYGHGRRAGVLSDYTFAVRSGARLATIGKAYSGLTDAEIKELTAWFLAHTRQDLGFMRTVEPAVVLEVAFDAITRSDRHDSGFALRFPRIVRIRGDKPPEDINTLDEVRDLFARLSARPDAPVPEPDAG
ncbi:MAG TPA: ATP-dependent DNA ligase [bacterium]|nr:ATP-dependent DNA ligase [bacterium]